MRENSCYQNFFTKQNNGTILFRCLFSAMIPFFLREKTVETKNKKRTLVHFNSYCLVNLGSHNVVLLQRPQKKYKHHHDASHRCCVIAGVLHHPIMMASSHPWILVWDLHIYLSMRTSHRYI